MTYSIGEVAELFNLSIHTLRYYEKEGVLPFVKRSASGTRQFDDASIKGLKIVECLKKSGMPLKDIKQFMDWCQVGDSSLSQRRDMFMERRETVKKQMAELQAVMDVIDYKFWYYDTACRLGSEKAVFNLPEDQLPEEIRKLKEKTDF